MKIITVRDCLSLGVSGAILFAVNLPVYAQEAGTAGGDAGIPAAQAPPAGETAAPANSDSPGAPAEAIALNFRGTPLVQVLDYLAKAAGFVIVKEVSVEGTADVVSHDPLTSDQAVEVLNTVLGAKGLTAVRTGRTLKIVNREAARLQDLPVRYGSEPEDIEKSDEMITQIIPVRHAEAAKLVDNLKPLLTPSATIGANESSNALIITDSQTNIRRFVTIIKFLDTSISMITEIRVFPLQYADAKDLATVVNDIFESPTASSQQRSGMDPRMAQRFMRMRGMPGPGGEGDDSSSSEAREAATHVKAVGDEHSNCLVVGAPKEVLDTVAELVKQVDIPEEESAHIQVFPLKYADAEDIADNLNELFDTDSSSSSNQQNNRMGGFFPPMGGGGPPPFMGGGNARGGSNSSSSSSSSRSLRDTEVRAVADTRTNSVVVSASEDTLKMIGKVIEELDSTPKNLSQVYIYRIQHADLEKLQELLEGMFEDLDTSTISGSTSSTTRTSQQTVPFGSSN